MINLNVLQKAGSKLLRLVGFIILSNLAVSVALGQTMAEVIQSTNMSQYPVGTKVSEDTMIETGGDQKIAIRTPEGDILIAGNNARIKLVKPGFFSQFFGKVYYFFTPSSNRNVTVQTSTATLGIRGTKFVIDSGQEQSLSDKVSLVEGKLNFQSNDNNYFQFYQQRKLSEFELYKQSEQSEFDSYKKQMVDEFVAFKLSIDLEQGFSLAFDGKKARQVALNSDIEKEIESFERFIADNKLSE